MQTWVFTLIFVLIAAPLQAAPEEADASEERARASFVDQFQKFTRDKNNQGRAKRPDGKVVGGGPKSRFNQDDGLPFQSDLTYHDFSFNSETKAGPAAQPGGQNGQQKPPETKRLFAFVSGHGAESGALGSSTLERKAFELDQKLTKADEQKKDQEEQEGVKYRSIFKITTKEIFEDPAQQAGNTAKAAGQPEEEKEKVDRFELREEARPEIDKVGADSAETILSAARGEQAANDKDALGNGVLLRQAAQEATKALWNSTLANLAQRRINKAIRSGGFQSAPQLSESAPQCAEWQSKAAEIIAKEKDPKIREKLSQELQRMTDQCNQVAGLNFNAIAPKFERKEDGKGEELVFQGPQKEDAFERDSRVQLEMLNKAGKNVSDIPANWQYTRQDEEARMTTEYNDNQPKEGTRTMKEQIESYNQNLEWADEGYDEVATRFKGIQKAKASQYAIKPGTTNLTNINKPPVSALEEAGVDPEQLKQEVAPQTYEQLIQNSKAQ